MDRFEVALASGKKLLAGFMTLGDPLAVANQAAVYLECDVDVLELGVPHPNPYLDGPLVAQSMRRALRAGVTPPVAQSLLRTLRRQHAHAPIVVMGYDHVDAVVRAEDGGMLADAVLQVGRPPTKRVSGARRP